MNTLFANVLTTPLRDLLLRYKAHLAAPSVPESVPKIHVDEVAAKVAAFYERLRNLIDYQEDHLLRKSVIGRILRRRLLLKNFTRVMAEPLIKEIIRSGHLPNDAVPEDIAGKVQRTIDSTLFLLSQVKNSRRKDKEELSGWLVRIASAAIEEILAPSIPRRLIAEAMFKTLKQNLTVRGAALSDDDITFHLFVGIERALLKSDDDQLYCRIISRTFPTWNSAPQAELSLMAPAILDAYQHVKRRLKHPHAALFLKLTHRHAVVFELLGDVLRTAKSAEGLDSVFSSRESLEKAVAAAYQKRFGREKSGLRRLAILSVVSFLLSKIAVALAVEIPLDRYLFHQYSFQNTVINIILPPLLMLVIVALIRLPSRRNLPLIQEAVRGVVFEEMKKSQLLQVPRRKGALTDFVVYLFYAFTFIVSLSVMINILNAINFSALNIVIFGLFVSLVAATGVKVANRAREISLEPERSNFFTFLFDLFAMPFITIGKWAMAGLAKFNILVVLVNFLIELPLQMIVEFLENLRGFIKSKREEIT